jgi:DNA processing protein
MNAADARADDTQARAFAATGLEATELEATLRLNLVDGVGPRTRRLLLERFGTATAVLAAAPSQLREIPGIGPKLTRAISRSHQIDVGAILSDCREHKLEIITAESETYPVLLREIYDPPGALFSRGSLLPEDAVAVAIVGTRHASQYGLRQAERLARGLARSGVTVVSGLARGIDAAAHRAAMAAGGRTLALLATGLLNIYPPEHRELADQIAGQGAILSEAGPRVTPRPGSFPQRNRLISGVSLGVVVVEAAVRSGALITAEHAMEQGREVFAVPGRVDSTTSRGCHRLLREGAKLVERVEDILEELGPLTAPAPRGNGTVMHSPAELQLNEQEQAVLNAIPSEPSPIDEVVVRSGIPVHRVLSTLSVLEMRHLIRRVSGSWVVRP